MQISYPNSDPAQCATQAAEAIASFDIGEAEQHLHEVIRIVWRTEHHRCESAHIALRHLGDRNYGKARAQALLLASELAAQSGVLPLAAAV